MKTVAGKLEDPVFEMCEKLRNKEAQLYDHSNRPIAGIIYLIAGFLVPSAVERRCLILASAAETKELL